MPLSYWSPCSASISPPLGSEGGGGGAHPYAAVVGAYTVCVHWLRALVACTGCLMHWLYALVAS